jgi:penicillin-binding protein 2
MRRLSSPPAPTWRIYVFYALLLASACALLGRLFYLQILSHTTYDEYAYENRVSRISDPAPRGIIYDRRMTPLVRNVPSFNIVITPADFPDLDDNAAQVQAIYARLSKLLDVPVTVPGSTPQMPCTPGRGIDDLVREGLGYQPYVPVKIKCNVSREVALLIRGDLPSMPGVDVQVEPLRDYPTGALTADVIGYMAPIPDPAQSEYFQKLYDYYVNRGLLPSRDRIGVTGIEASMQDVLAGQNGSQLVERDVTGKTLRVLGVETETVPGLNIQLTIDVRLQAATESILRRRIEFINSYNPDRYHLASGVAIAMNPQTGEVLSMVSWPTYDNNRFASGIDYPYYKQLADDPLHPMINHAVSGIYPPGSAFKIVTASGALEENIIDAEKQLVDPGRISIQNKYYQADRGKTQEFVCWIEKSTGSGHGKVNFLHGLAWSCDVYFYKIGGGWDDENVKGLGIDLLGKWMTLFGFGDYTGIELPGDAKAFVPTRDWKRINYGENWSTGDTYNAAIGQGYVLVTPLQLLDAFNVIATGGYLYKPTLISRILDGEGNVITATQPVLVRQLPISEKNMRLVQAGLRLAVTDKSDDPSMGGTLAGARTFGDSTPIIDVPGINVAGKTGTAEYCDEIAWKQGLCVPGKWPAHAWTALYAPYENPEIVVIAFVYDGNEGSIVAGPIAADIIRAYFDLKRADSAGVEEAAPVVPETPVASETPVVPETPVAPEPPAALESQAAPAALESQAAPAALEPPAASETPVVP